MQLHTVDWAIIGGYFVVALAAGLVGMRRAGERPTEFFLAGRKMPWWLLGFSMVATTFSTDTPNLVTDLVRQNGVAGNWAWWAFLLTGMLTVFIYARLWRRSGVMTDVEFYELRYSGRTAAFLRGFRALYLGLFFNIMIMAAVSLAAIKIGGIMLGLTPLQSILLASLVTALFSTLSGLRGVLVSDCVLFLLAMVGSVLAAVVAVRHPQVGGLSGLLTHPNVTGKLALLPPFDFSSRQSAELVISVLLVPLAVQWWSVWYPGSEPGGGGYLAQRMLAAKDERHATGATLFFNVAHYAVRPWPWILVALASLVVFPSLESLQQAFPNVDPRIVRHDLAYPAMLTFLPHGLLGVVIASLLAAYMSTISTHLNWGSSYVVNDFYRRFVKPDASDRELVLVGRLSTVVMMVLAAVVALWLQNAVQAFHILLQIGAGTGLIFILRWFWWRINALSELVAMVVSFVVAVYFTFLHSRWFPGVALANWQQLCLGVAVTSACWLAVAFLTRPTDAATLRRFVRCIHPGGPGWRKVCREAAAAGEPIEPPARPDNLPMGILCMFIGTVAVYGTLFATGFWIYRNLLPAAVLTLVAGVAFGLLMWLWSMVNRSAPDRSGEGCAG